MIGLSYSDADRLAKMIPNELNITLASAAEKVPELKRAIATEPATRQLWDYALTLEGLSRNAGVDAAAVVIGARDMTEYVPLCRDPKEGEVITQFAMVPMNDRRILNMAFQGRKTETDV